MHFPRNVKDLERVVGSNVIGALKMTYLCVSTHTELEPNKMWNKIVKYKIAFTVNIWTRKALKLSVNIVSKLLLEFGLRAKIRF